jgi:signal transduction histidine kinase
LRLTRDIRRLDYVGLFDPSGAKIFGDVASPPAIPIDGRPRVVRQQLLPDGSGFEPALFVARRRPNGDLLVFGRSLREIYELQGTLLRVLAIMLLPTILVILAIGALFARRASRRFENINSAIVRIMNGEMRSRLPVGKDDDDVEKVTRAVNLMLDEIERLLDQLKSVGDNIAHDLRTPLMIARTKIARTLDEDANVDALRATLESAAAQIDRATLTIAAVLRVSNVENEARKNRFKELDLGAVCAEVVDFYEPLAQSKAIELAAEIRDPAHMRGDEDLMREALSNLVDNAIKFCPEGGKVRVEVETVEGLPRVSVSDTGRGVPPADRTRIFRRFYRGEGADGVAGHGLGLSITQTIANLHGFQLTVEDNHPGARFVMRASEKAALSLARAADGGGK